MGFPVDSCSGVLVDTGDDGLNLPRGEWFDQCNGGFGQLEVHKDILGGIAFNV